MGRVDGCLSVNRKLFQLTVPEVMKMLSMYVEADIQQYINSTHTKTFIN